MGKKLNIVEEDKYKKIPRSSRICLRCTHKYSSHIDVKCLKIVQRKPERKECICNGFISNIHELQFEIDRLERRIDRLDDIDLIECIKLNINDINDIIRNKKMLKSD